MTKKEVKNEKVSRRGFLQGALAAGAATAATAGLTACSGQTTDKIKWDREVDVVVLGSGTVVSSAIVAAHAGLEVLVLEKASVMGGTTITSGGGMSIPNNYLEQEDGVDDSREKAFKYLMASTEGQSSEELINAWLDNGNEMLEWMRDNAGFRWVRAKGNQPFSDYYTHDGTIGGERRWVTAEERDGASSAQGLFLYVMDAFEKFGVEVMYDTPGKRLVYRGDSNVGDGEVIGVIAESNGEEIAIKARKGVVIGTGGFEHNPEMRQHFLRAPILAANTAVTNTGDGHLMGMAVGADLRNMNECFGVPFFKPNPDVFSGIACWFMWRGKPGMVVVNKHGERIGNEATGYDAAIRCFSEYDNGAFEWRNIPSFAIYDSGYAAHYAWPGAYAPGGDAPEWMTKADTLEELAEALGMDPVGLAKTMEEFNKNAAEGVDPVYHRGEAPYDIYTDGDLTREDIANPNLAPLETPPFYGAAYYPGTCSTNGGLRVNGKAQVMNVWGNPIPRLYCASTTMANPAGGQYPTGGTPVGTGFTFGYIAGKGVSALDDWS